MIITLINKVIDREKYLKTPRETTYAARKMGNPNPTQSMGMEMKSVCRRRPGP